MILFGFSIIYWLLLIEFLVIMSTVATESNWTALFSIIVFGCLAHWLSDINLFEFFKDNSTFIIEIIIAYLFIGIIWGFIKWFLYVRKIKEDYLILKSSWKPCNRSFEDEVRFRFQEIPPKASSHKEKIINWISLWPFSFIWSLICDFITNLFNEIYKAFSGLFQKISDQQFKDIHPDKDMQKEKDAHI
jgi:hypothetical protein